MICWVVVGGGAGRGNYSTYVLDYCNIRGSFNTCLSEKNNLVSRFHVKKKKKTKTDTA
jgi:hypothetical protein